MGMWWGGRAGGWGLGVTCGIELAPKKELRLDRPCEAPAARWAGAAEATQQEQAAAARHEATARGSGENSQERGCRAGGRPGGGGKGEGGGRGGAGSGRQQQVWHGGG